LSCLTAGVQRNLDTLPLFLGQVKPVLERDDLLLRLDRRRRKAEVKLGGVDDVVMRTHRRALGVEGGSNA
jgi:hypothetical protein